MHVLWIMSLSLEHWGAEATKFISSVQPIRYALCRITMTERSELIYNMTNESFCAERKTFYRIRWCIPHPNGDQSIAFEFVANDLLRLNRKQKRERKLSIHSNRFGFDGGANAYWDCHKKIVNICRHLQCSVIVASSFMPKTISISILRECRAVCLVWLVFFSMHVGFVKRLCIASNKCSRKVIPFQLCMMQRIQS